MRRSTLSSLRLASGGLLALLSTSTALAAPPDTTPPTVAITAPTGTPHPGLPYPEDAHRRPLAGEAGDVPIAIATSATDDVGVVSEELRLDGVLLPAGTSIIDEALLVSLSLPVLGPHTLELRAWDAAGNLGTATSGFELVLYAEWGMAFLERDDHGDPSATDLRVYVSIPAENGSPVLGLSASDIVPGSLSLRGVQSGLSATPHLVVPDGDSLVLFFTRSQLAGPDGTLGQDFRLAGRLYSTTGPAFVALDIIDTTGPSVTVDAPAEGAWMGPSDTIRVDYADDGVGVSWGSLQATLNGQDQSWAFWQLPDHALGEFGDLDAEQEGANTLVAVVSDHMGNAGTATRSFFYDSVGPSIAFGPDGAAPVVSETPALSIAVSDAGSGAAMGSLVVTLDGVDITASLTVNGSQATGVAPLLTPGLHTLSASVADAVGNSAQASVTFAVEPPVASLELLVWPPAPVGLVSGVAYDLRVLARTPAGQRHTTFDGAVDLSSSDATAGLHGLSPSFAGAEQGALWVLDEARFFATGTQSITAALGGDPAVNASVNVSVVAPGTPGHANDSSSLGMNLWRVRDWSRAWVFVDAFKMSREWVLQGPSSPPLDLDPDGWVESLAPGQSAWTHMFTDMEGHFPGGRYVVLYEGQGTIAYFGGATRDEAASVPGREVIDVDPANAGQFGIGLEIAATTAGNPIRNIRVIHPGGVCGGDPLTWCADPATCPQGPCLSFEDCYPSQVFHPTFLSRIQSFGRLRFMDWMDCILSWGDPVGSTWAERPQLSDAQWTIDGVPMEVIIDLCNRLHAEPWLSHPHTVDDGYISALAALVRPNLDPSLRVFLEWSNEVWNEEYPQHQYAQQEYAAELQADPGFDPNPTTDGNLQAVRYQAFRSSRLFQLWEAEFSGSTSRLVRVMNGQTGNDFLNADMLDFGDVLQHTDALGSGVYFGWVLGTFAERSRVGAMQLPDLMHELSTVTLPDTLTRLGQDAAVAGSRGLSLVGYEGGMDLRLLEVQPHEDPALLSHIETLFDGASGDPGMHTLYQTLLQGWQSANARELFLFSSVANNTTHGRYGALQWQDQNRNASPKYDAILDFIEAVARWW